MGQHTSSCVRCGDDWLCAYGCQANEQDERAAVTTELEAGRGLIAAARNSGLLKIEYCLGDSTILQMDLADLTALFNAVYATAT